MRRVSVGEGGRGEAEDYFFWRVKRVEENPMLSSCGECSSFARARREEPFLS